MNEFRCWSCHKIKPMSAHAHTRRGRAYCAPCAESRAKAVEAARVLRKRLAGDAHKAKRCKAAACGREFVPRNSFQRVCSVACSLAYTHQLAQQKAEMEARKAKADGRKRTMTRREWLKKAQAIANRYARVRDRDDGCISCDKPSSWHGQWHGSHYRPAGSNPAVRLHLWNIHKACSVCNNHLSGNLVSYRARLIEKIGIERVEWLERQTHAPKMDAAYLERYCSVIGKRLRRMERKFGS